MLLAFDVGNTNIVLGIFEGKKLLTDWRIATDKSKTADEYGIIINNLFNYHKLDVGSITDVIISSVVPPIMTSLEEMAFKYFNVNPMIVGPGIKTGMPILYENPKEVGADRIVNGIAAYNKYGGPLIIVDFGTATTFCAISAKGEYLGGAITPGVQISAEALYTRTAKLPKVELIAPKNKKTIGKNTVAAMQAGIVYGYCGIVESIVTRMKKEMGSKDVKVIATGGISPVIASESKVIDSVDKLLTLDGLRIIYEQNKIIKI
ncbi:pantothenate kinase [Desulfonispora thiosulfatigenes DSM 11270]|uniref:Type III pantothenate kinase n=1 Tax=Desulfonispora thiosulfatigenes DSM 11270 TaxID=656914 RepID=A0A1W1UYJ4_DESTI|nr:type III pantothenate kinase [Desulfonispora thiosulfatigenes]SMB86163.1 pantothenate kinase [Desulfonispora thiosulfatigenes DSM 11270]